jgi:hypothetical protein
MQLELTDALWKVANEIIVAIISGLGAILIGYAIKWARTKTAEAKTLILASRYAVVYEILETFVKAAEQMGAWDAVLEVGAAKKEFAIQSAKAWMEKNGVFIDLEVIDAMIEEIVLEQLNGGLTVKQIRALSAAEMG